MEIREEKKNSSLSEVCSHGVCGTFAVCWGGVITPGHWDMAHVCFCGEDCYLDELMLVTIAILSNG